MKKILLALITTVISCSSIYAQNTFPTSGNAGIGTTTPSEKLEISFGSIRITDNNAGNRLMWYRTDNTHPTGFASDGFSILKFITAGNERMTLNAAGLLGIGTNTPATLLDVAGTARTDRFKTGNAIFYNNSRSSFNSFNTGSDPSLSNGWISADFGGSDNNSDRLVLGTGFGGKAIIATHNFNLSAWGGPLLINPTGSLVGIGNTNPRSLLHVGSGLADVISIGKADYSGNTGEALAAIKAGQGAGGSLEFQTLQLSTAPYALSTKMIILGNSGNVGIGTATPNKNLAIAGSSTTSVGAFIDNANTAGYAVLRLNSGNADAAVGAALHSFGAGYSSPAGTANSPNTTTLTGFNSGGVTLLAQHATGAIRFFTAGFDNERMRIDANGKVGIGTNAPANLLHLAANTADGIRFARTDATYPAIIQYSGNGNIDLFPAGDVTTLSTAGLHIQGANGGTAGYIGIGTLTPDQKLAVNGTIHAKEVKVDLIGWNDYVFDKNYKLPTLPEVQKYIDQNHHLPEVPSEQEMVKNGLYLGDMNKLLMKKVEELTLYLIEKDKKDQEKDTLLKQQQQQINALQKQVDKLVNKH
jgi:hypothetical protein